MLEIFGGLARPEMVHYQAPLRSKHITTTVGTGRHPSRIKDNLNGSR